MKGLLVSIGIGVVAGILFSLYVAPHILAHFYG